MIWLWFVREHSVLTEANGQVHPPARGAGRARAAGGLGAPTEIFGNPKVVAEAMKQSQLITRKGCCVLKTSVGLELRMPWSPSKCVYM